MTPTQAAGLIGNGIGYIYVTDDSGVLGNGREDGYCKWPGGMPNTALWKGVLQREVFPLNSQYNGTGEANAFITVLSVFAGNLTAFTINGVSQITAAVAMTPADIPASVASMVAAMNSHVAAAPNDYRGVQSGDSFLAINNLAGDGPNGDVVSMTFTGGSTWEATIVSGGRSVYGRPYRVFVDPTVSATESAIGANAVEVTDILSFRGLEAPVDEQTALVVTNTVTVERRSAILKLYVDGVSAVGNANRVDNFVYQGGLVGDEIIFSGIDGSVAPIFTSSAFPGGSIELSPITLTGYAQTLHVRMAEDLAWYQVVPNKMDPATLRNNGVAIPLQAGVFQLTPSAGTATITPGATGVSAFPGVVFEQDVVLDGGPVVLGASLNFDVDATLGVKGDSGTIYGNAVSIDLNGNQVNFSDPSGIITSLTEELALSGLWAVTWLVKDVGGAASVGFTLIPDFGTANTQFITTAMIKDLNVTGAKIADTTITGSTKLIDGTVTEPKLSTALQAKINRLSPRAVVTLNNVNAVDGDSIFIDATVGNLVVTLPAIATSAFQRIVVTKTDASLNTVTLSGDANIEGDASYVLRGSMNSVTIEGNGTEWFIVAVQPDIPIECSVSITGLTTLNVTAANSHCRIVNVTSGNAAETITTITNAPKNVDFEVRPENGLALTITGTAYGGAVNTVALQAANIVVDGSLAEYIRLKWDGNQYVYQDSNQGII